jgi:hypothetical protein
MRGYLVRERCERRFLQAGRLLFVVVLAQSAVAVDADDAKAPAAPVITRVSWDTSRVIGSPEPPLPYRAEHSLRRAAAEAALVYWFNVKWNARRLRLASFVQNDGQRTVGDVWIFRFGAKAATSGQRRATQSRPPSPLQPLGRRSGCVPAEPYPPPRSFSSVAPGRLPGKVGQTFRPPPPAASRRGVDGLRPACDPARGKCPAPCRPASVPA